jgi:hypothetical protein
LNYDLSNSALANFVIKNSTTGNMGMGMAVSSASNMANASTTPSGNSVALN